MTIHTALQQLMFQLYHVYDDREAAVIADWVMERITGWKKIDRIINKKLVLSSPQQKTLEQYTADLLAHRPVQYVLNEAWFHGMKLYVDERVLIPRPETEELVEWIVADLKQAATEGAPLPRPGGEYRAEEPVLPMPNNVASHASNPSASSPVRVLDVGTGSGCIAIALQKQLPHVSVSACDISDGALEVARKNARDQEADIHFLHTNFLDPAARTLLPSFHALVSNPPYIPLRDKATMKENVVAYEPPTALFVENDDPLVFYRAIAGFAQDHLAPGGNIYTEIHEELGTMVCELFAKTGFSEVTLRRDMQNKPRMVKASKFV